MSVRDGLAVYASGSGDPLLLMPYPHGFNMVSMAEGPLAALLSLLDRTLITFDPPGAYRSTRPAAVTIDEMVACMLETLDVLGVTDKVDLVGHSMAGLCALAVTLGHPGRIHRLALISSMAGGPSVRKAGGIPWNWHWSSPAFWRFVRVAYRVINGRASMADHKRFLQLLYGVSYRDPAQIPELIIDPADALQPAPVRDTWPKVSRKLDYRNRLQEVSHSVLVCSGRNDPQAPLACSRELAQRIPGARLVVFENSGHYPYIEERDLFVDVLAGFFNTSFEMGVHQG